MINTLLTRLLFPNYCNFENKFVGILKNIFSLFNCAWGKISLCIMMVGVVNNCPESVRYAQSFIYNIACLNIQKCCEQHYEVIIRFACENILYVFIVRRHFINKCIFFWNFFTVRTLHLSERSVFFLPSWNSYI